MKHVLLSLTLVLAQLIPFTAPRARVFVREQEPIIPAVLPQVLAGDVDGLALIHNLELAADIIVGPDSNLQTALNAAAPGDTLTLQAGTTFTGNFVTPAKAGESFITVRSSRANELPEGQRVSPAQSALFAKLVTPNVDPALRTASTPSRHWRFVGIEFASSVNNTFSIVRLETPDQNTLEKVPGPFIFDRCWVHGQPTLNVQAGITLNSKQTVITNSYISEIHYSGVQSYGIGVNNSPGELTITNNYIEAAGLNIIFGGIKPPIPGLVPADILIEGNHLYKPPAWKGVWTTVNLLELKSARRWKIVNNLLENNWPDAQVGWAVIFNAFRPDEGFVEDGQFAFNTIRNSTNGINLRGLDNGDTFLRIKRIIITDNRLEGLGFGGFEAKPFQVLGGSEDVEINHNTVVKSTHSLVMDHAPEFRHVRLRFINNLTPHGAYGVFHDGGPLGVDAMNAGASEWQMQQNAFVALPGDLKAKYPGNYFPATAADAANMLGTDGLPVGVRSSNNATPTPTPTPAPTPTPVVSPSPSPSPTSTPTPVPSPSPSPVESPAPTPTPSPTPIVSITVVGRILSTDFTLRVVQINDLTRSGKERFMFCSGRNGNECYFERRE